MELSKETYRRGGSRAAATSKMELFVISILDAAAALDPAVYRIIFLLYLPSKQTKIWLKNINEHFVYKRYYDEKLKNLITQNQLEYKRAQ